MNLYLIQRTDEVGYDEYRGAVVAATTKAKALKLRPGWFGTWGVDPARVTVRNIGKTAAGTKAGVILSDYNAG